jgi:hypothetical protein
MAEKVEIGRFHVDRAVKDALVKALAETPVPAGMSPPTIKEYAAGALIERLTRDGYLTTK